MVAGVKGNCKDEIPPEITGSAKARKRTQWLEISLAWGTSLFRDLLNIVTRAPRHSKDLHLKTRLGREDQSIS
ncbi:hypothetical protein TWF506_002190 [Arthrobotrys conoides]|uniref:Uncharacterized protein n=1 Tax=Arthrobotrys conoides TaxID=74498 RepID=A0AAN8MZ37_9PEZI